MHPAVGIITFLLILSLCALGILIRVGTPFSIESMVIFSVQSCLCLFCIIVCPFILLIDYGDVLLIVILLLMIMSLVGWTARAIFSEVINRIKRRSK